MVEEAKSAGTYHLESYARDIDRISIVTIKEILEGAKLNLPMSVEVLKAAKRKVAGDQLGLGV